MTKQPKKFHIGAVLTVATGKFLTLGGRQEFYEIYSFMTGEKLYGHQMSRAIKQCQPAMLEQYPQFKKVDVPKDFNKTTLANWLKGKAAQFGIDEMLPVKPLVNHTPIDPIEEAISLGMDVLVVERGSDFHD